MAVLRRIADAPGHFTFWCPGCEEYHQINSEGAGVKWEFNGDLDKPTFSPSYLTWVDPNPKADPKYRNGKYYKGFRCHSFIRDGIIEYQGDCTHALAGKTVEMRQEEQ